MNLKRIVGIAAIIGLGIVIYSQYKKATKSKGVVIGKANINPPLNQKLKARIKSQIPQ